MKKIYALTVLGIFLVGLVFAQGNVNYDTSGKYPRSFMEAVQEKLQYQYNLSCKGECNFSVKEGQLSYQLREQKRFLFFNVEAKHEFLFNEEGQLIKERKNIWARVLNRNS